MCGGLCLLMPFLPCGLNLGLFASLNPWGVGCGLEICFQLISGSLHDLAGVWINLVFI